MRREGVISSAWTRTAAAVPVSPGVNEAGLRTMLPAASRTS